MRCALLGVAAAAALLGCGGCDSEDGDSRRPARPPAEARAAGEEFVRRVDAACKDVNPELAEVMAALTNARDAARAGRVSPTKTFEAFATQLRRASATTERLRARLRAIEVPRRERSFHRSLSDSIEEGAANLRRQVGAAEAQDAVKLRTLSVEGSVINARAKGLVAGHGGFRFCGRQPAGG